MIKSTLLILIALLVLNNVFSQPCLPDGIILSTQLEIDNFQTNHPNCTEIGGYVIIDGEDISNLNGLYGITSIGGILNIELCMELEDLSGLESLTSIGALYIYGNEILSNFSGLDNLVTIGGYISISFNNILTNLNALSNLNTVGGYIMIDNNYSLASLEGLNNINAETITSLYVYNNPLLSDCNAQSICDFLINPTGSINIYNNAGGCNNPTEVANSCGIELSCFPFGNHYLKTQTDVDNFFINFPDCFNLSGSVYISGENIKNLLGLNELTTIEGNLKVLRNDSLTNFVGLNNLTSIGGQFQVGFYEGNGNPALNNFTGLEALTTVGEKFSILFNDELIDLLGLSSLRSVGLLEIGPNNSLISLSGNNLDSITSGLVIAGTNILPDLSGLDNLIHAGNYIDIKHNESLLSLSGLDNIEPNSINLLKIYDNYNLSMCEVRSICEFLTDSNSFCEIHDNALGCNNRGEIEEACQEVFIKDMEPEKSLLIYPNPTSSKLYISIDNDMTINEINIYNHYGQILLKKQINCTQIDISKLEQGIYLIEIVSNKTKINRKLIFKK